jgi:hypothetical protein
MKDTAWDQCLDCKHLLPVNRLVCKAFPDGIPDAIRDQDHDHRKPYPGDNGFRYEVKKETRELKRRSGSVEVDPWKRKILIQSVIILILCAIIGVIVIPPLLVLIVSLIL